MSVQMTPLEYAIWEALEPRLEDVISLDLNDVDDSQTFRELVRQVASATAGVVAEEPEWEYLIRRPNGSEFVSPYSEVGPGSRVVSKRRKFPWVPVKQEGATDV